MIALKSSTGHTISLVPIETIKPHENVDIEQVQELIDAIKDEGVFTHPITVDIHSNTLLDGHHRLAASTVLGLTRVPTVMIEYTGHDVRVSAWRCGEIVTKSNVINAGARGKLMPIKTSRHFFDVEIGVCAIELDKLR